MLIIHIFFVSYGKKNMKKGQMILAGEHDCCAKNGSKARIDGDGLRHCPPGLVDL